MLAEWCVGSDDRLRLHVYCHVSGEERWLAPPALRKYIFQREMPLVRAVMLSALRHVLAQESSSAWPPAGCGLALCLLLQEQHLREPVSHASSELPTVPKAIALIQSPLNMQLACFRCSTRYCMRTELLFQQLRGLADAAVVVHLSSHLTVSPRRLMSLSQDNRRTLPTA